MSWIDEAGRRYQARIQAERPQFLVELDVPSDEVDEIFRHVSALGNSVWSPKERRLCIAVAAVNAAATADEDERSFIELFYRRLGRNDLQGLWETIHAPAIWQALDETFAIDLQRQYSGKFVNSIYRHAGIPVKSRKSFARFLAKLLKQGGGTFTRRQYLDALSKYPHSLASTFLESPAGFELTAYLAKWYSRLVYGDASSKDLSILAPCWRGVLDSVQDHLEGESVRVAAPARDYSKPFLALNVDLGRLEVRFDTKGIQQRVYSTGGKKVSRAAEEASDEPPAISIAGSPASPVSPWWYPGESPVAVFRMSDGAFVGTEGSFPPGHYWVATNRKTSLQDDVALIAGTRCDEYYRVFEITLQASDSIPELGITGAGVQTEPMLELVGGRLHRLGGAIYTDAAPRLRVTNWQPNGTDRFWLWYNSGAGDKRLTIPDNSNDLILPVGCPGQCEVWIEDVRAIATRCTRLSFSVIPWIVSVEIEELCAGFGDAVHVRADLPGGWALDWNSPIRQVEPGRWRVPAAQSTAEAILIGPDVRIGIALAIRRASLREMSGARVLWKECLTTPGYSLRLEGPAKKTGALLLSDTRGERVLYKCVLDRAGIKAFSGFSFQDAAQTDYGSAGQLALSFADDRSIGSGLFLASVNCLDHANESDLSRLPRIGSALVTFRRLKTDPFPDLTLPDELLNTPLKSRILALAYGAAVFDGTRVPISLAALRENAPPALLASADWYTWAFAYTDLLDETTSALLNEYPTESVEQLELPRWRDLCSDLHRRVLANANIPLALAEWREGMSSRPPRAAGTQIGQRNGGSALNESVRRYVQSLEWSGAERVHGLMTAFEMLRSIESTDPVVHLLAQTFRLLTLYRLDRPDELVAAAYIEFPLCCQPLSTTLTALSNPSTIQTSTWKPGIGLRELSPSPQDAALEEALGRPVVR